MILSAIIEKLKRRSKDDCRGEVPVTRHLPADPGVRLCRVAQPLLVLPPQILPCGVTAVGSSGRT